MRTINHGEAPKGRAKTFPSLGKKGRKNRRQNKRASKGQDKRTGKESSFSTLEQGKDETKGLIFCPKPLQDNESHQLNITNISRLAQNEIIARQYARSPARGDILSRHRELLRQIFNILAELKSFEASKRLTYAERLDDIKAIGLPNTIFFELRNILNLL